MHDINLLRPLIEQEEALAKSRGRFSFYITFTLILILLIAALIFGAKFYLSSQTKILDEKISMLERDVIEVKKTEEKINNFNNIITQLEELDKNKISWSALYENLAKSTPTNIKLDQVTMVSSSTASSSTTSAPKLKITGETKSRRAIALLADKLTKVSGSFLNVEIISSQKTSQEEEKIDFEINVTLKI